MIFFKCLVAMCHYFFYFSKIILSTDIGRVHKFCLYNVDWKCGNVRL